MSFNEKYPGSIVKNCLYCGAEFRCKPHRKDTAKWCSHLCYQKGRDQKEINKNNGLAIKKSWLSGIYKNRKPGGYYQIDNSGEKNFSWKGGITPINRKIRGSREYSLWRQAVFERDNYTCVWCDKRGVRIEADHIKPFSLYPELRFAIDNGRTLCKDCHITTETYGSWRSK